ncbi:uncharacterized protein LAJ45_07639 [Morchella importuna]|uniref:uncharacterized protein n=1 Tax=Morchella importuna TaxID=1174673 RepID=UPI001E8EE503|nr:uncharacterized protein LAJ45_07639 [Morchella importuna]KAH8148187.1 hypothetical protein LAJ45_07639 [Morchella importuna]
MAGFRRGNETPMDFEYDQTPDISPASPFYDAKKTASRSIFAYSPINPPHTPPATATFRFAAGNPTTPHSTRPTQSYPPVPRFRHKPILPSTTTSQSTGRGELKRGEPRRQLFAAVTKARRRRPQTQISTQNFTPLSGYDTEVENSDESDEDDEEEDEDDGSPCRRPPPRMSWRRTAESAAASFVSTHRDLPLIVSHYLQLFFNLSLLLLVLYAVFCFYLTIRADVDVKVEEYSSEILMEISQCSRDYIENRCAPGMRVPAMEKVCSAWERCMNRDPTMVGRARVSAETFAGIVDGFVEGISYKTMLFCLLVIFGGLFISNTAFGFYRAKAVDPMPNYHPTQSFPSAYGAYPNGVPPTPMTSRWDRELQQQIYDQQLSQQLMPGTPVPSTPSRSLAWDGGMTPRRTGGRERVGTGRRERR